MQKYHLYETPIYLNVVNFIKSSYAQCALGENYIVMKTCDYGGFPCNGLKVGKNNTPGENRNTTISTNIQRPK